MWWVHQLSVPCCAETPSFEPSAAGPQPSGLLGCPSCGRTYEVEDGVVRFADSSGYAESFGLQWERFSSTQIDHLNGTTISTDRLRTLCGASLDFLDGLTVYDAGCGAGRFTAVVAEAGARVIAADLGLAAVRACRANTAQLDNVICVHADAQHSPVAPKSMDAVLSVGVYQHTPRPAAYVAGIAECVRPGGQLIFWGYERRLRTLAHPHRLLRPLTKRLSPDRLLGRVEKAVPALLRVSDRLRRLPGGKLLARLVPVANYRGSLPLDERQLIEWAVLDTFDWLSPAYDRPMTFDGVAQSLRRYGFEVKRTAFDSVGLLAVRSS